MDLLTLGLSLIIFAGLYWLHRRAVMRAYAVGRIDERTEQRAIGQHGLAALPDYDHQ